MAKSGRSLAALATTIKAEIEKAEKRGIEHYRRAGLALIQAKERVGYGGWLEWLRTNCPEVNQRRARRYMELAKADVTSDLPETQRKVMGNGGKKRSAAKRKAKDNAQPIITIESTKEQQAEFKRLVAGLMARFHLKSKAETVLYALRLLKVQRNAA